MQPSYAIGPGTVLAGIRVEKLESEGPLWNEFLGVDERMGQRRRLTVIHSVSVSNQEDLSAQVRAFSQVRHQALEAPLGFELAGEQPVLIWAEAGQSLGNALERGELSESEFFAHVGKLARALDALHTANLGHPALEPDCLWRSSASGGGHGTLRHALSAQIVEAFAHDRTVLRSAFSAPESLSANDNRATSEQFRFALSLRELVGKLPSGSNQNVQAAFAQALVRAIRPQPADRYPSCAAFVEAALPTVEARKSSNFAPGSVIADTYRVTGTLGKGGMGMVLAAQHLRLSTEVAIKIIVGEIDEESHARFRREAQIASSLGHPNIVKVLDFDTLSDGKPYLVMERLQGSDLKSLLADGPLSWQRATAIVRQVGAALAAAHKIGVVHRDLKPANVFVSPREQGGDLIEHATVLDFGVCKVQDSTTVSTATHAIVGTARYMAPEQALGENEQVSAATDQFALGILCYEMLTGVSPFAGANLMKTIYAVVQSEPRPLRAIAPDVPESAAAAVHRALSKRITDRFDSVADFVEAFSGRPLRSVKTGSTKSFGAVTATGDSVATQPDSLACATPVPVNRGELTKSLGPRKSGSADLATRPAKRSSFAPAVAGGEDSARTSDTLLLGKRAQENSKQAADTGSNPPNERARSEAFLLEGHSAVGQPAQTPLPSSVFVPPETRNGWKKAGVLFVGLIGAGAAIAAVLGGGGSSSSPAPSVQAQSQLSLDAGSGMQAQGGPALDPVPAPVPPVVDVPDEDRDGVVPLDDDKRGGPSEDREDDDESEDERGEDEDKSRESESRAQDGTNRERERSGRGRDKTRSSLGKIPDKRSSEGKRQSLRDDDLKPGKNSGSKVVTRTKIVNTPTTITNPEMRALSGFNYTSMNGSAFLPKAQKLAREFAPDAKFAMMTVGGVHDSGIANLDLSEMGMSFLFVSPKGVKDFKAKPIGSTNEGRRCVVSVYVSRISSFVGWAPGGCTDVPIRRKPACSLKEAWDYAKAKGFPKDAVAHVIYGASGANYLMMIPGTDHQLEVPRGCKVEEGDAGGEEAGGEEAGGEEAGGEKAESSEPTAKPAEQEPAEVETQ